MEIVFHCVHGYWGSPKDFEALSKELSSHFPQASFQYQNLLDQIQVFGGKEVSFDSYLASSKREASFNVYLGYSLGGRLLTQYFQKNPEQLDESTLFLGLSSGCGLASEEEKEQRRLWEDQVIERIKSSNLEDFARFWSSLSIFESSKARAEWPQWSKEELVLYFDSFRLSEWGYFLPFISENKRLIMLLGEKDSKYRKFYRDTKHHLVPKAGHRILLDQPIDLANCIVKILKEELL
jgi:pimeloyl-ACP methyl ester carboxylesterase